MMVETRSLPVSVHDHAIRAMFAARKSVFVDLLKWDLPILDETFEIDQFDAPNAHYLIHLDRQGSHRASARLLPTEQPHLLDIMFADLCASGAVPRGADVREISRFCLDRRLSAAERRQARDLLVSALVDHALSTGIGTYTGVAEMRWYEQVSAFGWDCAPLGPPQRWRTGWLTAMQIGIDASTRDRVRQAGVYRDPGDVLCLETAFWGIAA